MKNIPEFHTKITHATLEDIPAVESLARQYPKELGFVRRVALEEYIQRGTVLISKIENQVTGFVLYRARKDGWNIIYDLAVSKDLHHQGIGRLLLYAVPTPVQLKVTVDNRANEFYKRCGMNLVKVEEGRIRPLNVYQRKYLSILCQGNNATLPSIVNNIGMSYGTRHTEKPRQQPFMVDINWKNYDWQDYLHKISLWKPVFALVPDYELPSQRNFMHQCIYDLKNLGVIRIGCCPKFDDAIYDIPEWIIICVSIPSKYAGFLPKNEELVGRKLHLLGGSPRKQVEYIQNHQNVISLDGNAITRASVHYMLYDSISGKWKKAKTFIPGNTLTYYDCIEYSARNLMKKLASL